MEKVLDIYSRPYDAKNPVVCMDETPRQLIRETREPIPAAPGRRLSKVTERRTKLEWAVLMQDIAASYPDAERITLVMDNLNTHTRARCTRRFPTSRPRRCGTGSSSSTRRSTADG